MKQFSTAKVSNVALLIACAMFLETLTSFFGISQPGVTGLLGAQPKTLHEFKHNIQGRVADGRYYGLGNTFSILLPATSETIQIEDSYAAANVGGVAFYNDYGFLLKIEVDELIPEASSMIRQHPEIKDEMLDALFYDAFLPQIKASVPKTQVIHERKITLENGEIALFAVLDLPEAATLADIKTGRSLDSKRGYLIFFANNKDMISLSLQDTLSFIPSIADAAKARLNERLLNHLLQYQSTFQIESNARPPKPKFHDDLPMP